MSNKKNEQYSEQEAKARFEAALRGALKTPHQPLKEKPSGKKAESPKRKTRESQAK